MCESPKVVPPSGPNIESGEKLAPERYFNLITTIFLLTGMYPLSPERSFFARLLHSVYFWCVYISMVVLNPVSKAIALLYLTNLDDFTDNTGLVVSHSIAVLKIAVFMAKRSDLLRLVETMESQRFRHQDCSKTFSANRLVREAIRTSRAVHFFFLFCLVVMECNSTLNAMMKQSEEIPQPINGTESAKAPPQHHRALPFHGWYPFSTETSPNYELVFAYQMVALFFTGQMVFAVDMLILSFIIHIRVQFQILAHNLRFIKTHAKNRWQNVSSSPSHTIMNETEDQLTQSIESDLDRIIAHHRDIIQLSANLESVFTYQLLVQFICSLLAICMLMWQVSSTPVLSARFASILPQVLGSAGQIFIYCWLGNEVMLESVSVAKAAWDSGWYEISSQRYCSAMVMMIQRSQNAIVITAGGFAGLTLETFMTISQAAYSCFAVMKKMDR